jgi:hypothetical protein
LIIKQFPKKLIAICKDIRKMIEKQSVVGISNSVTAVTVTTVTE